MENVIPFNPASKGPGLDALPRLSVSKRTRSTPFTPQVEAAGVKAYTVYNHMLLPTVFRGSAMEDYEHLRDNVQVWDVSCERQVQLQGPDAFELLELMTPRDMTKMKDEQCFYIPVVDAQGKLLNDPVALRVAQDTYWVSVASSDIIMYAKGLASGRGLDVVISEPDINPLGVQGPKAWQLMERVFGPEIHEIKFFRFKDLSFQGVDLVVAQSGFSGFGGFEIYVPGPQFENGAYPTLAGDLWDALFAHGADLDVGPGGPNWIDFNEAGLLSFGNTVGLEHTPFEAGFGKYCDGLSTCIGGEALRHEAEFGPSRKICGLIFAEDLTLPTLREDWDVEQSGIKVGYVSGVTYSAALQRYIGYATLNKGAWDAETALVVQSPEGPRPAKVSQGPFRKK